MHRGYFLNPQLALEIKRRLWEGDVQAEIADEHGVSLGTISKIVAGRYWAEVQWPDGSTGRISEEQRTIIMQKRQAAKPTSPFKRSKDPALVRAALMANTVSPRDRFIQWTLENENMPENRDFYNPAGSWIPCDREWAAMRWDMQVELDKADIEEKERKHQEQLAKAAKESEEYERTRPPDTEEDILEIENKKREQADRLKMWKNKKPQFEYWGWVRREEVFQMLNPETGIKLWLDNEDVILAWATEFFKLDVKETDDDHK
jgi:hypothetical protein